MAKRKNKAKDDGVIYSIVRLDHRYHWAVWPKRMADTGLLARGRSNSYRGAFYAVRNFIKKNQSEVYA